MRGSSTENATTAAGRGPTHCSSGGCQRAFWTAGDWFVPCKPDGTVLVHGDTKHEPRNWQPPEAAVQVTDTDPLVITAVRTSPREVILELKRRRVDPDAVSQLRRYVESVDVRGILVAPSITERAERLLDEFGLKSRQVAPPIETGEQDRSLAEFVAGDEGTE